MQCPICANQEMIVVEHNGIELDFCVSCRGIWFDSSELELLLEGMGLPGANGLELQPATATAEKPRACPLCRQPMAKVLAGGNSGVLIDACAAHGLWFDGGELGQVVGKMLAGSAAPDRVILFLGETFGGKK